MCHVHAFEFFGGVPERVVPDNLKAAVIKASFTDPVVNRVYHRLAEQLRLCHRSVSALPPPAQRRRGERY
jgi:transposase